MNETPPEKVSQGPVKNGMPALLQTRCGAERILGVSTPPPRTIRIQLAPIPVEIGGKPDQKPEVRVFYLMAKGSMKHPVHGEIDALLYIEGPIPDKPRIVVPGAVPVDKRIMEAR